MGRGWGGEMYFVIVKENFIDKSNIFLLKNSPRWDIYARWSHPMRKKSVNARWPCWSCPQVTHPWMDSKGCTCSELMLGELLQDIAFGPLLSAIVDWLALLKCHFSVFLFVTSILFARLVTCTSCSTPVSFRSGSSCGVEVMKPSLQGYCESETKASWEIHSKGSLNASSSSCSDGIVQLRLGHMVLCMSTDMYLWVKWPGILNIWAIWEILGVMVAEFLTASIDLAS